MSAGINYGFRAQRVKTAHTQETLASAIGVTAATVGNWEAGRSRPKPADMIRLSKALKVSVEDVVRMFA